MTKSTEPSDASPPSRARHRVYVALPEASASGIGLPELWEAVWNRKWLVVAVTLGFSLAAVAYSLAVTPVYRAEVVLAPASQGRANTALSGLSGLASLAGINLTSTGNSAQSIAILSSRKFVEDFIRDEDLLPVLFADRWNAETKRWMDDDGAMPPDIRDGVRTFVDHVRSVSEDPQTGLVTLAIEWTDPLLVADWAAKMVLRINQSMRERDIDNSQQKLDYLNEQLGKANLVELRQAIASVIEEQINAMMLAQAEREYAFKVIDPPTVPNRRIRPKRTIIVIAGTFLGGFVAVFIVLLRYALTERAPRNDWNSA